MANLADMTRDRSAAQHCYLDTGDCDRLRGLTVFRDELHCSVVEPHLCLM
jgi:hypothetical protein